VGSAGATPQRPGLRAGGLTLSWGRRSYVMGIVNASPDSFAGDGASSPADAIRRGRQLVAEGADLLDIGGESTRPGAPPVSDDVQLRRLLPVVEALASSGVPISVDTSSAQVATAALDAGAGLVNDVTGLRGDPDLAAVVAGRGAGVVVLANHRLPRPAALTEATGVVTDVVTLTRARWQESLALAAGAGVAPGQIILDPGLGFGLAPARSIELLRRLPELLMAPTSSDRPTDRLSTPPIRQALLVGPSRKGFVGWALGGLPVEARLEGTLAAVALAIAGGADVVRVHDVAAVQRVRRFTDAVWRPVLDAPAARE
jgi:dihydropteroate synthase